MPGIVQGKGSLLVGLEGKVEHSWPRPGARVGPPTGNLPVYRTLPVVEPGPRRGTEAGDVVSTLVGVQSQREDRQIIEDSSRSRRSAQREPGEMRSPGGGTQRAEVTRRVGVWERAGRTCHPGHARGLPCSFPQQPLGSELYKIHGLTLRLMELLPLWDCLHK